MYGKKRYRKTAKKGRKGRKKRTQRLTMVNRALNPIPARYITKMKYSDTIRLTSGGPYAEYVFRLNSIYDTDLTSIGHQPYSHDIFEQMYNRYRVISVRYYFQFVNNQTNAPAHIAIIPSNEPNTVIDIDAIKERPRTRHRMMTGSNSANLPVMKGKFYLPSLTGLTKTQYMSDDRYQSTFATSPAEALYLTLFTQHIDNSTSPNVYVTVNLEFLVELFDPKLLPQS